MYLASIASALPEGRRTQAQWWQALSTAPPIRALKRRSIDLLERVLTGNNGIEARHVCAERLEDIFVRSAEELNNAYEHDAPQLAAAALRAAFEKTDERPLDALFVCSCTGYLCPGISSHLAQEMNLPASTYLMDITGAGCGAAIPSLRAACNYLAVHPTHRAAVVAAEVCSAAFYADDDPGVLISMCLFGDGASAVILDGTDRSGSAWQFDRFSSLHVPEEREKIRFVNREGKLCNKLHKTVPEVASKAVRELFPNHGTPVQRILSHVGGRDVLAAIREAIPGYDLEESRAVLRECGNVSSPAVLMALEKAMQTATVEDKSWWLVAFGAGFACHGCMLSRA